MAIDPGCKDCQRSTGGCGMHGLTAAAAVSSETPLFACFRCRGGYSMPCSPSSRRGRRCQMRWKTCCRSWNVGTLEGMRPGGSRYRLPSPGGGSVSDGCRGRVGVDPDCHNYRRGAVGRRASTVRGEGVCHLGNRLGALLRALTDQPGQRYTPDNQTV